MVKATRSVVLVVALLMLGVAAMAGDYHTGITLICSNCHVMHYSLQHGYTGGAPDTLGGSGPYTYLLKNDINDLCLTCHNGQATAPDVLEAHGNGYVREAGALNEVGSATPYEEWKGHTLASTATAPGGSWSHATEGLECVDCHSPHGSSTSPTYRNLKGKPGTASANAYVTEAAGTNDSTKTVFERDATLGQISTHYAATNVDLNEPSQTASGIADWCKGCHTNFHGAKGGTEVSGSSTGGWWRHPSADADIGALGGGHSKLATFNGHTNKVKVMDAAGLWNGTTTTVTQTCLSCHKGHGNQNAFGLIYMRGTGTVTEQGDDGDQARDLCKQCHSQGS